MAISTVQIVALVKRNPVGVTCLAISLAVGAALYVRWDKIGVATEERDKKEALADRLRRNKENATDLKEQLDRIVEDNKAVGDRLLQISKGAAAYVGDFYRLQTDVPGIRILEANPQSASSKSGLGPVSFALTVTGSYPQLLNVIRRLESGTRFSRITNLNLSVSTGEDKSDTITLRLNIDLLGTL